MVSFDMAYLPVLSLQECLKKRPILILTWMQRIQCGHSPIRWQSMRSETGEWIPSLVLVNVKELGIIDGSNAELGASTRLKMSPTKASRVDPGLAIVPQAPSDPDGTGLDLQKVTSAQCSPIHLTGRNDDLEQEHSEEALTAAECDTCSHRFRMIHHRLGLNVSIESKVGDFLGLDPVFEATIRGAIHNDLVVVCLCLDDNLDTLTPVEGFESMAVFLNDAQRLLLFSFPLSRSSRVEHCEIGIHPRIHVKSNVSFDTRSTQLEIDGKPLGILSNPQCQRQE